MVRARATIKGVENIRAKGPFGLLAIYSKTGCQRALAGAGWDKNAIASFMLTGSISTTAERDRIDPLRLTASSYSRLRQVSTSGRPDAAKRSRHSTARECISVGSSSMPSRIGTIMPRATKNSARFWLVPPRERRTSYSSASRLEINSSADSIAGFHDAIGSSTGTAWPGSRSLISPRVNNIAKTLLPAPASPRTTNCRCGRVRNAPTISLASPSSGSRFQSASTASSSTTLRLAATGRPVDDQRTCSGIGWNICRSAASCAHWYSTSAASAAATSSGSRPERCP